ncbi:MAG TPA: ABC transporter substrate-binding protein [Burkholderiaceae bacterium]|jgi:branched-chain amino acid transport system substrate-binding protein|nr:ABC transporter substrate-binding protein [Burkholderiaceae bacterium]
MKRRHAAAAIGALGLTGLRGVRAAEANEVVLGQSAVITGPLGGPIRALISGAQMAFDAANAVGGVHGRKIKLVTLDDELAPPKAVANYKKLLEEQQALALFGCVGSGTTAAAAKVLQDNGAASVGGYAVADSARQKAGNAGFFVRASTGREAEVLLRQLTTIGIDRIAVAHLDNPGGAEALNLVARAMEVHRIKPVASGGVKGDGSNAAELGRKLAEAKPQAVIMYLSGKQPADLMPAMRAADSNPMFYGMSIVSGEVVAKALGEQSRGLAIAQVMPYPWSQSDTDIGAYQRAVAAAKLEPNYYSLEGWINAQVMIEALKRTGRELTRGRLLNTLRAMKMRIAGLDLDFTAENIAASRFVELVQVRHDGRFVR